MTRNFLTSRGYLSESGNGRFRNKRHTREIQNMREIQSNNNGKYRIDKYPDECPICCKKGDQKLHMSSVANSTGNESSEFLLTVVFQCPSYECNHLFLAYYTGLDTSILKKAGKNYRGGGIKRVSQREYQITRCETYESRPRSP